VPWEVATLVWPETWQLEGEVEMFFPQGVEEEFCPQVVEEVFYWSVGVELFCLQQVAVGESCQQ
jgi:hypothetical protein